MHSKQCVSVQVHVPLLQLQIKNQSYFPVFPAVLGNMTNSRFFANPGKICRYCGHINKQINNRCAKCHESLEQESKGFSWKIIHSLNRQACKL